MKRNRTTIILLIFLIFSILAYQKILGQVADTLNITYKTEPNFPFFLFEDKNGTIDLKSILQNDLKIIPRLKFIPKQYREQSFWCYLELDSAFNRNNVIVTKCPNTLDFKAYAIFKSDSSGALDYRKIPFSFRNENYTFEIPQNSNQILIKIKSSRYISFAIECQSKSFFFMSERSVNIYYGLVIGVLLLLFLYHSILSFIVREKLYFFYILHTAFSAIYITLTGLNYFSSLPYLYIQLIFILLQIGIIIVFVEYSKQAFISSKSYNIIVNLIPVTVLLGLYNILKPSFLSDTVVFGFPLIMVAGFIVFSLVYRMKGFHISKFFLSSWIILFLGQLTYFIAVVFLKSKSSFFCKSFEQGLIFNNILISLELGNKLNIYKNEKNLAEISEITALKEKESFINEHNQILENLISERNKELINKIEISLKQKKEIEEQNEIINNRIKEIERINNELIQKNMEISDQNVELEKHHITLEKIVNKRTKKLVKAKEKAEIAEKLKTSFLNNLTQEISTPMNAITGYSSMITDKGLGKETRNEYLHKILRYVDILLDTVDNIVILSRIQAGIIKPRVSENSLTELLYSVQSLFDEKGKNSDKPFKLNFDIPKFEDNLLIKTDKDKIWQILNILIDLLIKQKFEGDIKIKVRIKKHKEPSDKKKDKIIYNLIFNQFNPNKNKIFKVFENYFNNPAENIKYNNPVELGIAIIKGLLKISRGKLQLKNLENEGYNAKLVFPAQITRVEINE